MFSSPLACALALLAAAVTAAPAGDEITKLPGWNGTLPSKMYSGYVTIGGGAKHIHYWYTEAQEDPENKPVVLWSNGGPGSSSLIGMLTELGTFALDARSLETPTPRLIRNPNAWARLGNMLYFEHPAGVGYSYCDNQEACDHTDESAANDLRECIEAFFTVKFPELKGREFWMTGESYAGIYIPMTALSISAHSDPATVNLQGFAHGDGCIGNQVGTCSPEGPGILADFLHGQRFISTPTYRAIQEQCVNYFEPSDECDKLLDAMQRESGNYFVYMIDDLCPSDHASGLRRTPQGTIRSGLDAIVRDEATGRLMIKDFVTRTVARHATTGKGARVWSPDVRTAADTPRILERRPAAAAAAAVGADTVRTGTPVWYCDSDQAMSTWLNDPAVQKATHVNTNPPDYHFRYNRTEENLLPQYPGLADKYRILIYSGNADACVPTPGSEQWTDGLGFEKIDGWRPWLADINGAVQSGGFVNTFRRGAHNFTFATLTLSGHMAPQFVGEASFAMIERFLHREAM